VLYIGTAGWAIPVAMGKVFPPGGSHLERYGQVFSGAEINSSFYRSHRQSTWERWAKAVPATFRFAVKAPKTITHESGLNCTKDDLENFMGQAHLLGSKLGPILFQTPPSLAFDSPKANRIFSLLRGMYEGPIAIEPRHLSWFAEEVDQLLTQLQIARVAADPAPSSAGIMENLHLHHILFRSQGGQDAREPNCPLLEMS
jgi:uncharacterized protein YecE (DUF72 family)